MNLWEDLFRCVEEERPAAVITVVAGDHLGAKLLVKSDGEGGFGRNGTLGSPSADDAGATAAVQAIAANRSAPVELEVDSGTLEVFIDVHNPPPTLLVVGAVHTAIPLVTMANTLGFHTVVIDARAPFATEERFGHADELIVRWPADAIAERELHEETYVVFLSHDPKLDNPALVHALSSRARYVGALGSKKTHVKRVAALEELGVAPEQIERIHAPIGLPLGGRRPEEIAVSIAAQIVQARHGLA